ncbi:hypothetical protein HG535_0F03310 [Zygotorulaspora mrakii]|uniref:ER membrane protein complex subunit 5 n=1 Tax=Zygotorulaspora mrakii TaxID=42260 RepID=A0A7H9B5G2_ZYGMR|nr:uncharacterized protein HG535_0F03310 [Zygotorulaspora mrakii]QLG73820.1 hypothetical protein HG535_0F03310 [Zygotorulaspora mrakii]
MRLLSKLLLSLSVILLGHSGFSSHEFRQLLKNTSREMPSSMLRHIPVDIQYEAIVGLVLFVLSTFLSFEKITYYPLQGGRELLQLNQYLQDIDMSKANNVNNLTGKDPFGAITYTPNFIDIHKKRKHVATGAL